MKKTLSKAIARIENWTTEHGYVGFLIVECSIYTCGLILLLFAALAVKAIILTIQG